VTLDLNQDDESELEEGKSKAHFSNSFEFSYIPKTSNINTLFGKITDSFETKL
jgi:hypothetical protein